MNKNNCPHEDDIFYMDLVQVDGIPYYTVKCMTCGEYGTIQLEEGENIFGMSENEIEDFISGQALK